MCYVRSRADASLCLMLAAFPRLRPVASPRLRPVAMTTGPGLNIPSVTAYSYARNYKGKHNIALIR